MFESSKSPSLSLQKQLYQFERMKVKRAETEYKSSQEFMVCFSFFLDLAGRDISDLSVLEVAQCAFISEQHGKQTLTDLFIFFSLFVLAHSVSQIMGKHAAQIY